jgi:hypothetical protein
MTRVTILTLLCSALLTAQAPADREGLAKIRTEGLEHSRVAPVFEYLTIELGPRLTASPAHNRAAEWTRDRLASYGLQNAHLEAWQFGRGWSLEKLTVEMIEPRYLQNNEEVRGIFDSWLEPLKGVGVRRNNIEPIGSTDHLSFIDAGVPGFNPIQDYVNYDIRTHHTNMDTVERLDEKDIQQAAIVMATFAYQAANADRKIPHKERK